MKPFTRHILLAISITVMLAYISTFLGISAKKRSEAVCTGLKVCITDSARNSFVTSEEICRYISSELGDVTGDQAHVDGHLPALPTRDEQAQGIVYLRHDRAEGGRRLVHPAKPQRVVTVRPDLLGHLEPLRPACRRTPPAPPPGPPRHAPPRLGKAQPGGLPHAVQRLGRETGQIRRADTQHPLLLDGHRKGVILKNTPPRALQSKQFLIFARTPLAPLSAL